MVSMNSVTVIIPALNEEAALQRVLADLPRDCLRGIIVVDNGSSDATAEVARRCGATVVQERRKGYGSAMLRGLAEMGERFPDTQIVVFLDGDYSDDPAELPRLVDPIAAGEADF